MNTTKKTAKKKKNLTISLLLTGNLMMLSYFIQNLKLNSRFYLQKTIKES